ncbi:MAG: hypothetical protein B6D34_08615 [Candidatus Brocadia sp. UTAMX1]|jgi:uncharacterized protein with HEPN domain|nr:MAG: hypothetical protein B6D34_08615 [Candidatus Brocadia sp. UTAMX1]
MQRDRAYMLDIIEAAKLAVSYIENKRKEDFLNDIQCQDAVIRRLEIIGEAARRITDETMTAFPSLPWREMIGIRNIMIHEYDDVDLDIVFKTVQKDLPSLIKSLEEILK